MTLDSASETIESNFELPILYNYNSARAPLPSLHFWKGFRSDICLAVLRHATKTSITITLSSANFGCLWEALAINSLWMEYTPSEYRKVGEIVPIVGTMGSDLVTYDSGILRTPNLILGCSVTSYSSYRIDVSLMHAVRSSRSSYFSHAVVYNLNCWILLSVHDVWDNWTSYVLIGKWYSHWDWQFQLNNIWHVHPRVLDLWNRVYSSRRCGNINCSSWFSSTRVYGSNIWWIYPSKFL